MRILLLGGSGLLGKALNMSLSQDNTMYMPKHHELDITQVKELHAYINDIDPDIIINAAAMTSVYMCEKKSASAFLINSKAPAVLAGIAHERNIRFIHFSTNFIFDGKKGSEYDENDIPEPLNVYAQSKRQGELMVLEENPDSLIIRSAEIFGKGPFSSIHNIPYYMIRQIISKKNIHIYDIQTSPTHAYELADKVRELIQLKANGILHLANRGNITYEQIADMLFSRMRRKGEIVKKTSVFEFEAPSRIAIKSVRNEELGIEPMKTFEDAMDDFLAMVL